MVQEMPHADPVMTIRTLIDNYVVSQQLTSIVEISAETVVSLEDIQQRNFASIGQLEQVFGNNLNLIDIKNITTQDIFNTIQLYKDYIYQIQENTGLTWLELLQSKFTSIGMTLPIMDMKFYDPEQAPKHAVVNYRSNIMQLPIPLNYYPEYPYKLATPEDGYEFLGIDDGISANSPVVILGECNVENTEWYFVRAHGAAGWVEKSRISLTQDSPVPSVDYLRPLDTLREVDEKGYELNILTGYGLTQGDESFQGIPILKPVDPYKASTKLSDDRITDIVVENKIKLGDLETMADGIIETGESALVSIGDWIVVEGPEIEIEGKIFNKAVFPDGRAYLIPIEYLNKGFLEATQENVLNLAQEAIGKTYSWGDGNGISFDCSGFSQNILKAFGIYLPNGSWAQGFAGKVYQFYIKDPEASTKKFPDLIPKTTADLRKLMGLNDNDPIPWGFISLSWKTHIMLIIGENENGELIFLHSTALFRDKNTADLVMIWKSLAITADGQATKEDGNPFTYTLSPYSPPYSNVTVHV
jgi:hypothetical protein